MSEFIIRPCRPSDAEGIHALRVMEGVRENILALPSERLGFCEAYLNGLGPDDHQFAAAVPLPGGGEKIVGTAGLQVYPGRMRHSAGFGIMVHRDWQGRGVGRALMEAALDVADNWLMLTSVELTVFTDNARAIGLYKSLGFEIEGTKRMGAIRNGEYADEYYIERLRPPRA